MTAWRLRLAGAGEPTPILVEGEASTSKGAFVEALAATGHPTNYAYVDGERWTTAERDENIGSSNLRNGSIVSEDGTSTAGPIAGTYLVVVAGPDAGRRRRLDYHEQVVIGRAPGPGGLQVEDALMSSRHLSVELGEGDVVRVADLGSKNGSVYEDEPLDECEFESGRFVHAGASLFAVIVLTADDRATIQGTSPTGLNVHRRFREALADLPAPPEAPTEPRDGDRSGGSAWWRSLMPLVTAVGFAVMFGRWQFLLIAAFAPIVYAADNQRRKKNRKRESAAEKEQYRADLASFEERMRAHLASESRRRRSLSAGGGASSLLAEYRHRSVWERLPTDPDFLAVTLGFADLPSDNLSRGDARAGTNRNLWKAPLSIALTAEGPLSITGPMTRASGVARSLLVELVFAHAPVDVVVWVFTDETRARDWEFVQWLPHAFTDDGGARLAVTPTARMTMMQSLRGTIDARRDMESKETILPLHVVVVDGVDNLGAADLTALLRDGPRIGVYGVVTDPSIVPEGVRSEVKLGRFDDECSYSSVVMPRVDDVVVSQLSGALAEPAGLALAPLEAFRHDVAGEPVGTTFFTELVDFGDRTPEEQAAQWRQHSPRTSVPVGVTMDGQPLSIDVVRHGPHGLIGGMTRSGKTEFLKTLLSSLAIHNHPDDLAIAIIDFKAGVDHRQTSRFPHVVALATNQNIDRFARTVTMLTAEIGRRQELFDGPGVSTIEGYRTARDSQPSLPPIPRLVIVVDEFVELLETPEGKAEIGRLESISRVGAAFGVHLLLVTQKFTSSLPPQIDGQAGLRICFKVGDGADSKTVIGSAAAAGISAAHPGRGFAQFSHSDVVQFQSARIGNKSLDVVDDGHVSLHHVTYDSLTTPPAPPEQQEVPDVDQDLFRVVEIARQAARVDPGSGERVPWPAELTDELRLDELGEMGFERDLLIGVADDPEHQRLTPVRLGHADAVTAIAGSSDSGHHDALMTIATACATSASPDDLHLYGIDLVGHGLSLMSPLPHVGSVATRDDATALRILGWLITEAATRRTIITRSGASDFASYRQMGGRDLPRIVLLVLGADRMFLHGEGASSPLLGPMTTVVNEVAGTGIQVVFTGSLPMLQNRLGTTASRRLVFRANDPGEYPATVSRALRGQLDRPMRCVDSATNRLAQIATVCGDDLNVGEVYRALGELIAEDASIARPPRAFTKAPWPLQLADITRRDLTPPAGVEHPLPIGVRPETGAMFWVDPREDGTAFRFIGGPKSGRSNALAAVGVLAGQIGWHVLVAAASRRSPLVHDHRLSDWVIPVESVIDRVTAGLGRPTLLLVDDANRLDDAFEWQRIAAVTDGPLVTIVSGSTEALTKTTGIMRSLGAPNGVVLMPARTRDSGGVGVTAVDDDWVVNPLAGIGVIGIAGEAHRIQFPLVVESTV